MRSRMSRAMVRSSGEMALMASSASTRAAHSTVDRRARRKLWRAWRSASGPRSFPLAMLTGTISAALHDVTCPEHQHGPDCGHESVQHGDHIDYVVGGHLHHPHGDHCDHHGPAEAA